MEHVDDPDRWVLDDDFVAAGRPESSLPHRRPHAAVTKIAYGAPSAEHREGRATRPGGPRPLRTGSSRRDRRLVLVLALAAATALVALVASTRHSAVASATSAGTTAGLLGVSGPVLAPPTGGLNPRTRLGACLTSTRSPAVACISTHGLQLVAVERAGGSDSRYPAQAYFAGPIARRCYTDLLRFTGRHRDTWPAYLTSTAAVPSRTGWASGDRTVYCLARLAPAQTVDVRHLPTGGAGVITAPR